MSYIGQVPIDEFVAAPTKDVFTGDASTTTFDLANSVAGGAVNALEVFIDNVRQEPGSGKAFTLGVDGSGDMKRITFTSAPANSAAIYVLNALTNTTSIAPVPTDLNGVEFILDADGDTSITADTDDRIDIKVSNTDQIQIADGVIKPVTDSDIDLGTSSLYFKNAYIDAITTTGNVTVGGDLTITGTTSFADTNITNVGSIALDTITNDGTDVTIDSSGDIILDADGTQVFLKDGGTTFGSLTQVGGQLVIKSSSSDTTALTFAGANATFAGTLTTAAGGIATASLADDAVTLAKMDGLARGKIIYGNASGNPTALTVGSSGQALVSDGTDISWGSGGAIATYSNSTNNRVLTSVDSSSVNSEANLTFDGSVLAATGNITATGTMEPAGDTAANDNAAIGYTSAEGLILTGQGSTNDVTIKNDADAAVISIPTGTTGVTFAGTLGSGAITSTAGLTGTQVDITAQGDLRLQDTTGGQHIAHQAAGTTTTYTVTWPGAVATANGQALKSTTGGVLSWGTAGTAWQGIKTSAYTASAGEGVFCDTDDTAAFTVTLPASPTIGDEVSIIDCVGNAATANITVGRNSEKIQGASSDLTISTNNAAIKLVYSDSTNGWRLANND